MVIQGYQEGYSDFNLSVHELFSRNAVSRGPRSNQYLAYGMQHTKRDN